MKSLLMISVLGVVGLAYQQAQPAPKMDMEEGAATTYEHLATAIIEIEATEDNLVKGILMHHYARAVQHLEAAKAATGGERTAQLEKAASEIGYIANEVGKRVQAIRQRLLKAGHVHNTDEQTKEDYMFVNSSEKKELLALSTKVSKLGAEASPSSLAEAIQELGSLFQRAVLAG
jgi:hypothetical protein